MSLRVTDAVHMQLAELSRDTRAVERCDVGVDTGARGVLRLALPRAALLAGRGRALRAPRRRVGARAGLASQGAASAGSSRRSCTRPTGRASPRPSPACGRPRGCERQLEMRLAMPSGGHRLVSWTFIAGTGHRVLPRPRPRPHGRESSRGLSRPPRGRPPGAAQRGARAPHRRARGARRPRWSASPARPPTSWRSRCDRRELGDPRGRGSRRRPRPAAARPPRRDRARRGAGPAPDGRAAGRRPLGAAGRSSCATSTLAAVVDDTLAGLAPRSQEYAPPAWSSARCRTCAARRGCSRSCSRT